MLPRPLLLPSIRRGPFGHDGRLVAGNELHGILAVGDAHGRRLLQLRPGPGGHGLVAEVLAQRVVDLFSCHTLLLHRSDIGFRQTPFPGSAEDPAAVVLAAALAGGGVALDGGDIAAGGALHDTRVAEPVDDDIPGHGVLGHPLRLIRPVPAQQRGAGAGSAGQWSSGLIEAPLHKGHAPGLTVQAQPLAVLGAVGAGWALRGAQLSPSDVQRPPIQRPPPAGPPRW